MIEREREREREREQSQTIILVPHTIQEEQIKDIELLPDMDNVIDSTFEIPLLKIQLSVPLSLMFFVCFDM